jgi:23S rRNA pseudouridine1911/1915/1917 synthase
MTAEQVVIDRSSAGMRLDLFLSRRFNLQVALQSGFSRSGIQRLIAEGQITLNGATAKPSTRLKLNDRIDIKPLPPREATLEPEALPLDILYEDADCVVINKAPGMVVHPAVGRARGTLVNALLHHCPDLQGIGGVRRPGIVHRLDKDTSGVMIVAKNMSAFHQLVSQFKNRTVAKEYLALVWGELKTAEGIINRPIGRHRSDRKRMSSVHTIQRAREAVTEWRVEERFTVDTTASRLGALTLLRLRPRTGRTHQLRVHLADMGYPLVGDRVYGGKPKADPKRVSRHRVIEQFPRQALHAERLTVDIGQPPRRRLFVAPMPRDLSEVLGHLRAASATTLVISTSGVDK